jgi:hypothetical protein
MFERFTDQARQVVVFAGAAARARDPFHVTQDAV